MNRSTTWEAANVTPRGRSKKSSSSTALSPPRRNHHSEADRATLEATLHRLSKAYNAAMECIGALHRADAQVKAAAPAPAAGGDSMMMDTTSLEDKSKNKMNIIRQVSRVARRTLEEGILVDALVGPQAAPVWTAGVQQQQQQQQQQQSKQATTTTSDIDDDDDDNSSSLSCSTWIRHLATPSAAARPLLTSAAHERTVQQIAYLALVNYADLLWCACTCGPKKRPNSNPNTTLSNPTDIADMEIDGNGKKESLLDRGIVKKLKTLRESAEPERCCCCWNKIRIKGETDRSSFPQAEELAENDDESTETPEQTLQLIVWALMDATALDGSDPLVWLKLACASRRLGRFQGDVHKYRLLERYALEQGIACRPNIPNRLVVQAYKEWQVEQDARWDANCNVLPIPLPCRIQRLELPRYSWAVLGRMLLRACRGETNVLSPYHNQGRDQQPLPQQFATISLGLSQMLALPLDTVMKEIVSFLDPNSYGQLKASCRTFSMLRYQATASNSSSRTALKVSAAAPETAATEPSESDKAIVPVAPQPLTKATKSVSASSKESTQGSRVSKRLRSQIITSGKRTERSQRRNSVEYCLYAVVLGTAPPSGTEKDENKKKEVDEKRVAKKQSISMSPDVALRRNSLSEKDQRQPDNFYRQMEALERMGPGSLTAFVGTLENESMAPLSLLFKYVAHVALYTDQVCLTEHHGTMVLLSSVSDCLEVMLKRTHSYQGLIPSWSTREYHVPAGAGLSADQIFAIDLLHAELRFKRCDRDDHHLTEIDFDSDANIVQQLVPTLGRVLEETSNTVVPTKVWNSLRVRYQWLVAGYYLWRSRISHDVVESREAEQEGLDCIKEIISLLEELGIRCVPTPHLEGIGRSGDIWKELSVVSLTLFQNKVQASSIVLKAQEQFIDAVSGLVDSEDALTDDEKSRFRNIASYLLVRYSSSVDSPESNYFELVEDFLGVHGKSIFSFSLEKGATGLREWFTTLVPTGSIEREMLQSMKEPCIISILVSCMQLQDGTDAQLLRFVLNLIRTLERYQRRFLESSKGGHDQLDDPQADTMSDDDLSLMSGDEGPDTGSLTGYAVLLGLLIETLELLFQKADSPSRIDFIASLDLFSALDEIFRFCSSQPVSTGRVSSGEDCETSGTFFILERLSSFLRTLDSQKEQAESANQRAFLHAKGLVAVLNSQESCLKELLKVPPQQKTRHSWKTQVNALGKDIGFVCLSLGELFSLNPARVEDGIIISSPIVDGADLQIERLTSTLLSIFNFSRSRFKDVGLHEFLRTPIAAALIGFCGSAACTKMDGPLSVALTDFVDSDESATEWMDEEDEEQRRNGQMLRILTQIVHVVHLAVGDFDDRHMCRYNWLRNYVTENGPLLPLICCRVLNFCADILLEQFHSDDSGVGLQGSIWSDFPVGTRKVGSLLDSLLHKVYRCLHGFNLSSDTKELNSLSPVNDSGPPSFLPEGIRATAQLYRCVIRASGFGRKTSPKAALDTIKASLPDAESSPRAKKLQGFLFDSKLNHFNRRGLVSIIQKSSLENPFAEVAGCFSGAEVDDRTGLPVDDETSLVRQGIARLIAHGPLPQYQENPDTDARVETSSVEGELSRKFNAILFDLSHGNIANCKSWVKAAQCCWAKSEIISDRLGRKNHIVSCPSFSVKGPIPEQAEGIELSKLLEKQEREDRLRLVGWTEVVGQDLSLYMHHCWSSFESLKEFSLATEAQFQSTENKEDIADSIHTYEEITRLFRNQQFDLWQQSWGGVFVSALRSLAHRCLAFALYISYKDLDTSIEPGDQRLAAEICESFGTFMYSEVSGSQINGYPMRTLTQKRKREYAEAAAACFGESMSLQSRTVEAAKETIAADWDLLFMIGKCHEKIASTFVDEKIVPSNAAASSEHQSTRRYEHYMKIALQSYAKSFEQSLVLEKEGAIVVEQQGGSGHGGTEVQYRLHATRLKCLINALVRSQSERDAAESEALRLVEEYWFAKTPPSRDGDIRDRAWCVLTDVVDAMIQCRSDYSCFHRSVYRHAQALLWAPLVCDPKQAEGSFGTVPGSRAYKLRGLNSGSAVESAASVIGSLFDRRRAQLCAVWVTQGSAEAFEQINVTVRKYDSLRGKYIAAYVETLDLCHQKNDLETFWRWIAMSQRDLPSYFHVTAGIESTGKRKTHTNDCLILPSRPLAFVHFLADVKRSTNAALASVLLHEVKNLKANTKVTEAHLKQAYSCFLRLNCETDELHKSRVQKSPSVKPIIDALVMIYTKLVPKVEQQQKQQDVMGDWSLDAQHTRVLDSSLEKCRELFPSLSNNFLSTKKPAPKRKRRTSNEAEASAPKQVFRVNVPEGLAEGDTFLTEIMVGETKKRLRLTVPKGGATTLRFSLAVPTKDAEPAAKKNKIEDEAS